MDSFVLAETFKYLYLLFTEKEDLVFNLNQFVFTTEAHILPLSLSTMAVNESASQVRHLIILIIIIMIMMMIIIINLKFT